jgi:circadian clock protein KaiC
MTEKVSIRQLASGVPGLDAVLGGGIPEFSFNLVGGAPGTGKTTLVQQIMFSLAHAERLALFFSVLGEPSIKMLRYQQQFEFFDLDKVDGAVRFVNLAQETLRGGLDEVLTRIIQEVEAAAPGLIVVDSFRSVIQAATQQSGQRTLQQFIQELGLRLAAWEATTFLVGEFQLQETEDHPVFTVADGLIWLSQSIDRNSMVRKMQIMKMRGQATIPGLHTFRISNRGVQVFPRMLFSNSAPPPRRTDTTAGVTRLPVGVPGLDEMLGGGIPAGHSVLVVGPSGSGKSVLVTHFLNEGVRRGERGILVVFEKRPIEYTQTHSLTLDDNVRAGQVSIIHTRPLDLSIDEVMYEVTEEIERLQARRVVIDSLCGFELALAPTFREDFRESLYRMIGTLTATGLTVMLTAELEDRYTSLQFSPHSTAFLTDAIIMQRYVEFQGQLRRIIGVVKLRASDHNSDLHFYTITSDGLVIGEPVGEVQGFLTGEPRSSSIDNHAPRDGAPRTKS